MTSCACVHANVYVCPFKVHLFILYTRIILLSTIILSILEVRQYVIRFLKISVDKSEYDVYNVTKVTQGGFIYIL